MSWLRIYYVWVMRTSLMTGLTESYGLVHTPLKNGLKRTPGEGRV